MMGVGKTTVGRALAERLNRPFFDSDAEILRRTGRTVQTIFEEEGEAAFREQESAVLREAIASDEPSVIAVAGGAVLDEGNRKEIDDGGIVVHLDASLETLIKRLGSGEGRPLLGGDPAAALPRLLTERQDIYHGMADIMVLVDDDSPNEVAATIVEVLEESSTP